jgi:hypothetical protein
MNPKYIYPFFSLLLFSCTNNKTETDNQALSVINLDKSKSGADTFEFESVQFIPLETRDDCLVGNIDKIVYQNKIFYILDRSQKTVSLFSEEGKHIHTIQATGLGPFEYVDIQDFDVDRKSNVYIGSPNSHKIIKYQSPNYNKAVEFRFDKPYTEFCVDNKTDKIWIANVLDYNGCIGLALYSDEKLKTIIEPRKTLDDISNMHKRQSFYKSGDYLYFNSQYSSLLYEIKDENIIPVFKIESGNFVTKSDFPINNKSNILCGFHSLYRINGYLYGDLWWSYLAPDHRTLVKYDTETSQVALLNPTKGKLNYYSGIYTVTSDCLISVMDADYFREIEKKDTTIPEDANPILVKIKI